MRISSAILLTGLLVACKESPSASDTTAQTTGAVSSATSSSAPVSATAPAVPAAATTSTAAPPAPAPQSNAQQSRIPKKPEAASPASTTSVAATTAAPPSPAPATPAPAAEPEKKSAPAAPSSTLVADGATIFGNGCPACHGANGNGDTAMGKKNNIPDLRSAAVQSLSDTELTKILTEGKGPVSAAAHKGKHLTGDQIRALIAYIRSIKS